MANWKKVIVSGSQAELNSLALDTALTVANGGTGASTLTDGGVLLGSGTGAVTALGQATNGQLVIGSTGGDPVLSTLTEGTGVTITNTAGGIEISAAGSGGTVTEVDASGTVNGITLTTSPGAGITGTGTVILGGTLSGVNLTSQVSGILPIANGGTNISSYTTGDILYASSGTALAKLAIGTSGQILAVSSGGIVEWIDNDEGDITSVANTTNGGLTVTNGTGPDVTLTLNLNDLSAASVDVSTDSIAIIDANDSNGSRKESIADLATAMAGAGLAASSGVLSTTLNPTISASIYTGITGDVSITAGGVSSVNSVQANSVALGTDTTGNYVESLVAGSLIDLQNNSGEGATPTIDVDLTEAAAATIVAGDNIIFLDGGALGAESKGSINDVANLFAGNGLTATGAVIAVDYGSSANDAVEGNTTITINGTTNEVEISSGAASQALGGAPSYTIGLPDDVTIANDLTVLGDLEVSGTASFKHSENLDIADKFITLSSGSTTPTDGGIIVAQDNSGGTQTGEGYGFDASVKRWGVTSSLDNDSGAIVPKDFMVTARASNTAGSVPSVAPIFGGSSAGYGNIHVDTSTEDIYIYA